MRICESLRVLLFQEDGENQVTLLYLEESCEHGTLSEWVRIFNAQHPNVQFELLPISVAWYGNESHVIPLLLSARVAASYRFSLWLLERESYEVVILHEWLGIGYYAQVWNTAHNPSISSSYSAFCGSVAEADRPPVSQYHLRGLCALPIAVGHDGIQRISNLARYKDLLYSLVHHDQIKCLRGFFS